MAHQAYNASSVTHVLIVSESPALALGLQALLGAAPDMLVIGQADDAHQAADLLDEADVVLADGLDSARAALSSAEGARPGVVLLESDAPRAAAWMRRLGVERWAVLPPYAPTDAVIAAVRAVASGLIALSSEYVHLLRPVPLPVEDEGVALSPRELEVLQLASQGLPSKLIASQMGIAESTVKFHLSSVYAKLGVASRAEAISRAVKLGLVTL